VQSFRVDKLRIREKIAAILRTERLPGTEAYLTTWTPRDIALPEGLTNSFWVSIMNFSFQHRSPVGMVS
jgi:hypothetical protein